ncbi:hypothetical protein BDA96_02G052800 [Sorghum bicolor]|uniref:Uncharacterized protein n=2 Tax=Sorghum bicolor TaxID=4558 RepID=A0A921RLC9_SORBI|nr:hypothetical protein BDA96_02G052800 [Sorghum bicolor]KXG34516.1 hypothetical protein SORBI_3002G052600 [Sorghum bicolor]
MMWQKASIGEDRIDNSRTEGELNRFCEQWFICVLACSEEAICTCYHHLE